VLSEDASQGACLSFCLSRAVCYCFIRGCGYVRSGCLMLHGGCGDRDVDLGNLGTSASFYWISGYREFGLTIARHRHVVGTDASSDARKGRRDRNIRWQSARTVRATSTSSSSLHVYHQTRQSPNPEIRERILSHVGTT
jgi:hypothetical protein